jgi:polyisoprenoid-binding protein YceI
VKLDSTNVQILVQPAVEGPLAMLARPPVLRIERLDGELDGGRVEAEMDVDSLGVHSDGLLESERSRLHDSVRREVLECDRFPRITFRGSLPVSPAEAAEIVVQGALTLHGVTRQIALRFERTGDKTFAATLRISQLDYGITPLSAFMGALKAADPVELTIRVSLGAALNEPERAR